MHLRVKIEAQINDKHEGGTKRAGSRTKEQHSPSMFEDEKLHTQARTSFFQNRKSMLDLRQDTTSDEVQKQSTAPTQSNISPEASDQAIGRLSKK